MTNTDTHIMDLFVKVELKRLDSHRIEIYFDGKKQDYISDVKIELLPARPAKVICTQIKANSKGHILTEIVDGEQRIARQTLEVLASSLTINI